MRRLIGGSLRSSNRYECVRVCEIFARLFLRLFILKKK